MVEPASNRLVIYNSRVRWVAVVNLAAAAGGIYFSLRYLDGGLRYLMVGFLALFSLFWVRDVLFGFPLKLLSDGVSLQWQDGKQAGAVPLREIRSIAVGVQAPRNEEMMPVDWTYVTLHLANRQQYALPPNLAQGLRARNWRHLKRVVEHIRTVSPVVVVPFHDRARRIEGVDAKVFAAPKSSPAVAAPGTGAAGRPSSVR